MVWVSGAGGGCNAVREWFIDIFFFFFAVSSLWMCCVQQVGCWFDCVDSIFDRWVDCFLEVGRSLHPTHRKAQCRQGL